MPATIEVTEDRFALPDDWQTACRKSWACWDASETGLIIKGKVPR